MILMKLGTTEGTKEAERDHNHLLKGILGEQGGTAHREEKIVITEIIHQ